MSADVIQLRRTTIGGSDVAAACGIDPHRSPVMLWLEKTGRIEREQTEAMLWGRLIEPLIFERLRDLGYDAHRDDGRTVWQDHDRAWVTGSPDGFVVADDPRVVEVKTANVWAHRTWGDDDLPPQYAAQVQWYLHLTGLPGALVAVLVAGQRLEVRDVARSERAIGMLLSMAEHFYGYLLRDEPPPPDGSQSSREALAALYPQATVERVRLDMGGMSAYHRLKARREQEAAIKAQRIEAENELKAMLGDAELAISPGDTELVRWSNAERRALDIERLKSERPDVYAEYLTQSETRRFTVL